MNAPPARPDAWERLANLADASDALDASPAGKRTPPDASDASDASPKGNPGARLLDEVLTFGRRFVAFPSEHAAVAWVVWVMHTHLLEHLDSTPRLAVVAPEKQSGKTRVLEVTETLVPRPMRSSSTTTAVLFRLIDSDEPPTVLLDEADAVWSERGANEDLRALLNAGHRRGSKVHRMVGEGARMSAKPFRTFSAVALAGIGMLPDTLMDRSVPLHMKRRAPHERVERWRFRQQQAEGHALRAKLEAWLDTVDDLQMPEDLDEVSDRAADVWEPLIACADLAGGHWPARVRDACRVLTAQAPSEVSLRVRLLSDLRDVWPASSFAATVDLLKALADLEESPWGPGGPFGDHGLTPRKLGHLLAHYEVKSTHREDKSVRGYRRADLEDPWSRYLPPAGEPSEPSEPSAPGSAEPSEPSEPSGKCPHGMVGGQLPDLFVNGAAACPQCRAGAA